MNENMKNQWKMVPVTTTLEMDRAAISSGESDDLILDIHQVDRIWSAMLAASPVPPAGDVEVFSMKYGERPTEEDGQIIRHADHLAVVDRLTAERDGLLEKLADTEECYRSAAQRADLYGEGLKSTSDELTKARELLAGASKQILRHQAEQPMSKRLCGLLTKTRTAINKYLATPIAHKVDESYGQDAEAAKGGEPLCLLCLDEKTVPGLKAGDFVRDCPDCCGEEG